MSDIQVFNAAAVPDFIKNAGVSALTKTLAGGDRTKRIVPKNGIFNLVVGGESMGKVKDSLHVIITNASPKVGRIFYLKQWSPDAAPSAPDCFSNDGNVPDPGVAKPQAANCNSCPQNIKGSGQGTSKACRYSRRLAVMLESDFGTNLEGELYQMNLASKSLFGDKQADRFPFEEYTKYLRNNGRSVDHMVTRISFNEDNDNQSVLFSPLRYVVQHEFNLCAEKGASEAAVRMVTMTPYQADMAGRGTPALTAPLNVPGTPPEAPFVPDAPTLRADTKEAPMPEGAVKSSLASVVKEWGGKAGS